MKTKIIIQSTFDNPPEEIVNECLQALDNTWMVASAHTTVQYYCPVGEPGNARPNFVVTLVLTEMVEKTVDETLLQTPIEFDTFSVRAVSVLNNMNAHTIGDIARCSEEDLRRVRNCGLRSIRDFRDYLARFGLQLRGDPVQQQKSLQWLGRSISELPLRAGISGSLRTGNIETIGQLTQKTEEELLRLRNMGHNSIKEIQKALAFIGLSIKIE